jgi:XTP/dITP diphosphohydrolase
VEAERRPLSTGRGPLPDLVLATRNAGKALEMVALLSGVPFRLRRLADYPAVTLPPEDGWTYTENAAIKARAVAAVTGTLAIADDSGLEVDALGGRPGVHSARYGGSGLGDLDRVALLLAELRGVPAVQRTARFRCAIAVAEPGGKVDVVEGVVEGQLLEAARGAGGFGYDPIFYHPPSRATFAELSGERKNAVSHRSQALIRARRLLIHRSRRPDLGRSGPAATP